MGAPGRFTVLLGGDVTPTARLLAQVAGSRSIAADSGMAHARALGLTPELWVGDFDSTPAHLAADYRHIPRQTHPANKDQTDGEIAIEAAIARGATELVLAGGMGGQTDHVLGHVAQLLALAKRGLKAFATSGAEEAHPLIAGANLTLQLEPGARLSIIAFSDLEGLDIAGVRWPLTNAHVSLGSTRTLSNVVTGEAQISLTAGSAIVVAYPTSG
jgi:thiamine pyrophosphokinase